MASSASPSSVLESVLERSSATCVAWKTWALASGTTLAEGLWVQITKRSQCDTGSR